MFQNTKVRLTRPVKVGFVIVFIVLAIQTSLWGFSLAQYKNLVVENSALQQYNHMLLTYHFVVTQRDQLLNKIQHATNNREKNIAYQKFKTLDYLIDEINLTESGKVTSSPSVINYFKRLTSPELAILLNKYRGKIVVLTKNYDTQLATIPTTETYVQFTQDAKPIQNEITQLLNDRISNDLLINSKAELKKNLERFEKITTDTNNIIILFGGIGVLLATCILFAIRRSNNKDTIREKHDDRVVQEITLRSITKDKEHLEENINDKPEALFGHVLVAEDCPSNQNLISEYLTRAGVTVEVVDNGLKALQLATTTYFDLILIDCQMPIMDGLTTIQKLREAGCQQPIVTVTDSAAKDDYQKSIDSGANACLTKPVDPEIFYSMIREFLSPIPENLSAAS